MIETPITEHLDVQRLIKETEELQAENVTLMTLLLQYGTHDENCLGTCNCGLNEGFELCRSTA